MRLLQDGSLFESGPRLAAETRKAAASPIGRDTLSQQVYAWLRGRILRGEIAQGARLNEVGISNELNVSATPVREALRLLNGDGLVHFEGRRGARVIQPTRDEIRHCFSVRAALEALAVREAIANLSVDDKARLAELVGLMGANDVTPNGFSELDRAFHEFLVERSGNVWLRNFHAALSDFLLVVRRASMQSKRVRIALREHRQIAAAILAGDVDEAAGLIERHIRRSCDWALESFEGGPSGSRRDGRGTAAS